MLSPEFKGEEGGSLSGLFGGCRAREAFDDAAQCGAGRLEIAGTVEFEVGEQVQPADDLTLGRLWLSQQPFQVLSGRDDLLQIVGIDAGEAFTGFIVVRVMVELVKALCGEDDGILGWLWLDGLKHQSHVGGVFSELDSVGMCAIGEGFGGGKVGDPLSGQVCRLTIREEFEHALQGGTCGVWILSALEVPLGDLV